VVCYALAGTADIDLYNEPLGTGTDGNPVYMRDIWPSQGEIADVVSTFLGQDDYRETYANVFTGDARWQAVEAPTGKLFDWDPESTYIQHPPYFEGMTMEPAPLADLTDARCLALLGDSVTTDHISPAGGIKADSPAGRFLQEKGVTPAEFNSYGARRGNHEVMMRGTFANIRLRNKMAPGTEGGWTLYQPTGEQVSIYDAAMRYRDEGVPVIVIAGKEYGSGSSRDWAAKGPALLGVKAVIAESYERIHRTNLVCMGVLPLQFQDGDSAESLGLTGYEQFTIAGLDQGRAKAVQVTATDAEGNAKHFTVKVRIDTPNEVEYYQHGGILPFVLRKLAAG
jgi:aconitate hydratase